MNELKKKFFDDLVKDREESANMLEKPSMRGVQRTVVEKYSDQAHFIYELLQNADDVEATKATFNLYNDRLIFIHNGKRYFSVTNPLNEDEDSRNGTLGDINSITSIANSNKTTAKIGKFGVGFKAVFQYTSTPMIYDPEFRFQIDRFIVPRLIKDDYNGRKKDETVFVFPFNNKDKSAKNAYNDIFEKFQSLIYPLLFLKSLKEVDLMIKDRFVGKYSKQIEKSFKFDDVNSDYISLNNSFESKSKIEKLWLFTSKINSFDISVGFFVDDKGKLKPVNEYAFCFFPTKETTNLNFIIQAPFLLTDSREGIKVNSAHNKNMIIALSKLAAKSILLFKNIGKTLNTLIIDENILFIIPTNENIFSNPNNKNKISFFPFYQEILNLFMTEEIIPTKDGFSTKSNAVCSSSKRLINLFSNDQLSLLSNCPNVKWVFTSFEIENKQSYLNNDPIIKYIKLITNSCLNENSFLTKSNPIQRTQSASSSSNATWNTNLNINWSSLSNSSWGKGNNTGMNANSSWGKGNNTGMNANSLWTNPLNNGFSAPKNFNSQQLPKFFGITSEFIEKQSFDWLHLFYKWINESDYRINLCKQLPIFLDSKKKAVAAYNNNGKIQLFLPIEGNTFYTTVNEELIKNEETMSFFKKMGILKPSFLSEIEHVIIPKYTNTNKEIIDTIPDLKKIFAYYKECPREELNIFVNMIKELNFLIAFTPNSKAVLRCCATVLYFPKPVLFEYFCEKPKTFFINLEYYKNYIDKKDEKMFLEFLEKIGVSKQVRLIRYELPEFKARNYKIEVPRYTRYLHFFEIHPDGFDELFGSIQKKPSNSIILWKYLLTLCKKNTLKKLDEGICNYFYYRNNIDNYISVFSRMLKTEKWLLNSKDELVSADEINLCEIEKHYECKCYEFNFLIDYLEIKQRNVSPDLNDEQQKAIDLYDELKNYDLLDSAKELLQSKKLQTRSIKMENIDNDNDDDDELTKEFNLLSKVQNKIEQKLFQNASFSSSSSSSFLRKEQNDENNEIDFIQPNNYHSKKYHIISDLIKHKAEIERISKLSKLSSIAENSEKYSFLWFKTLLQMERIENNYSNNTNKSISIVFSKVELEESSIRTLILKHPNRYIPMNIEELTNASLILHFIDSTKAISIEVINVQSYSIRAKFKSPLELEGIDLNKVKEAEINATNPIFLFEELSKSFLSLNFDDNFDLYQNLSPNIDFIFGPPGTGKTTYLSQKVLIPFMQQEEENLKILVLTPTNKAADVVVKRIIECMKDDDSYAQWLIRFGTENDESKAIYKERTFDIEKINKYVIITTIARFPYDYFKPKNSTIPFYLKEINWDYIIFDEASMIPLINIIYPLYKSNPKKFIVAGDPFQIQPITSIEEWKNENIFSMIGLNSFTNPQTKPHNYHVELLTTQFRSVPSVGNIYSKLTYGGILKHNRSEESKKKLNIDEFIQISSLNLIRFPVSKIESIYKPKRLQNKSSYHVYSALLVFEFVKFLSQKLTLKNGQSSEKFSIGIIAAYRAQTDLIDKLFSSFDLPRNIELNIGTIHGFQGDECDIIIALFNSPPKITGCSDMFLNNINIINVSISRTKDYLFVLMPDDKTENINMLKYVNKVEELCKQNQFSEFSSHQIENLIFGDDKYLEKNCFATTHQLVNVYSILENKYEIRSDETAIDVFINNS